MPLWSAMYDTSYSNENKKWDLIKLSFCTAKGNDKQGEKTTLRMGENDSKSNK